jgi:protein-S-isoprenylcysteine O-methyltransferase Ste14
VAQLKVPPLAYYLIAFLAGMAVDRYLPLRFGEARWIRPAAWTFSLAAGALAAWAIVEFRRASTTVMPYKRARALVTSGPFGFTRNPMYVALAILHAAVAAGMRMIWPILFLPLAVWLVTILVIHGEEARMREGFGEEYAAYARRVRRWV